MLVLLKMKEIAEAYLGGIMTYAIVAVPAYLTTRNYRLLRMLERAVPRPLPQHSRTRRKSSPRFEDRPIKSSRQWFPRIVNLVPDYFNGKEPKDNNLANSNYPESPPHVVFLKSKSPLILTMAFSMLPPLTRLLENRTASR